MSLGGIGRVHVNKWGDGGAHLHLFFLARPAGFLQLRGSNLPEWEEMLPRYPQDVADAARCARSRPGWPHGRRCHADRRGVVLWRRLDLHGDHVPGRLC